MGSDATGKNPVGAARSTGTVYRSAPQGCANIVSSLCCPYCRQPARLLTAQDVDYVYSGRKDYGPVWACLPCHAWVTCHPGTHEPTGRLADSNLRAWKIRAHRAFDPLWKNIRDAYPDLRQPNRKSLANLTRVARTRAYLWLAHQLGRKPEECHIGHFDVLECERVVSIVETQRATAATIRQWAKGRSALSGQDVTT